MVREIVNEEFKNFKIVYLISKNNLYFKTSEILKNIDIKDNVSSLINSKTSSGFRYDPLFENVKKRGKYKNAYYFSSEDMKVFMGLYNPKSKENQKDWQMYVDWVTDFISKHESFNLKMKSQNKKDILNTLTRVSKMLCIGVKKDLVPFLINNKFLYRQQGVLLPFDSKISRGLFKVKTIEINKDSHIGVVPQVMITTKGFNKIRELWNKK